MAASTISNMPAHMQLDKPTAALNLETSHISLEDRNKIQEERERLYQTLDEKDDEIQEQSQLVEKLKEQMLEQEELISSTRRDYENLTKEMSKIQGENDSAKDEVKDVLQALEELAVNYDQKSNEAETKNREYNTLSDELSQKQSQLNTMNSELHSLRESSSHQKKRVNEMLRSLLTDLGEVGTVITKNNAAAELKPADAASPNNAAGGKIEEEFTVARFYAQDFSLLISSLVHKTTLLETAQTDGTSKMEHMEKDLSEQRLLVGQLEAKMKSTAESMQEVETKKRQLEEHV